MKKLMQTLIVVACLFVPMQISYGQQADAPVYKDGDWWRVKVEVSYPGGISRAGRCEERYSEYTVKIEHGKPKVYGVKGSTQEEIDCPTVEAQLLDSGPETRGFLKFPLDVGRSWPFRYLRPNPGGRARWTDVESKAISFEKVKTLKGEQDAFKIKRVISKDSSEIYFYSPRAKAIVLFDRKTDAVNRFITLVDFGVSD